MKKTNKFLDVLILFLTFARIGLFTFGGGYAMIPLIQNDVVKKHKWLNDEEMLDVLTISESTPGPIAINSATYVGFKVAGFWGSIFATFGVILPSFLIIFIISIFYDKFITLTVIQAIFKGLKIGVIILLIKAIFSLSKAVERNLVSAILFCITLITTLCFSIFGISFPGSTLIFIALGLLVGIVSTKLERSKK